MIRHMGKENICTWTVQSMREIGLMISNMDMEWNSGQMVLNMTESIIRGRSIIKVILIGRMDLVM